MKKYMKVLTTIFLATIIIGANILNVQAGSVTLSFNGPDTVKVGDNITLTVSAHDISGLTNGLATAQGDLLFDESYLEYVSFKQASSKLSVSYGTKTKRFVALGMGGEYVPTKDDLFNITFKAKQIGTTTLNIKDVVIGDTKAIIHSSNILEKQINIVDASNNTPTTTKKPSNSAPKKKPSAPTTTRNDESSDNELKSLFVNNGKMSPSFSPDNLTYNVIVAGDVTKLDLKYLTNDSKATVKVEGNTNLGEKTVVKVIVTAEDGTTRTYTLKVTKSDDNSSNRLILLNVKEGSLKEEFNSDKYEYSITVPKKTKKLTIDAIPERKDCKVEIIGNRNLGKGTSTILIKLTDKNGYSSYYRLNVKKSSAITIFGIDIRYIIIILVILFILFWLLLLLLGKRKKEEEEVLSVVSPVEKEVEDPLFDDVVTKDEIIEAIEKRDPKLLKMLLTQEEANRLKDEIRNKQSSDPYDEVVTKREIIDAIEKRDTKKLKMLLTQEEANKLKEELKERDKDEEE